MPAKMCPSKGRWELFRDTERAQDTMLEADLTLERWAMAGQVGELSAPTGVMARCSSWTRGGGHSVPPTRRVAVPRPTVLWPRHSPVRLGQLQQRLNVFTNNFKGRGTTEIVPWLS